MKTVLFVASIGLVLILSALLSAAPRMDERDVSAVDAANTDYTTWLDPGNILLFITNDGWIGYDRTVMFSFEGGMFIPYDGVDAILDGTTDNTCVYSSGLWIGGIVNGDTLVSIAEYLTEFWPGPMSGGAHIAGADSDPQYRVYKLYADSMADNPNDDYLEWPVANGAPVDGEGKPALRGDQTLWSVFNDANPNTQDSDYGGLGTMGIEVQMTTWGSGLYESVQHTYFIEYKLYNRGNKTINDMYIGIWSDPDLGFRSDDFVGCDTLDDLFYAYNADNDDAVYGNRPPAVGYKFMYGPLVPATGYTGIYAGATVPNMKNLGMTSFYRYINGTDPTSPEQMYRWMAGIFPESDPYNNGTSFMTPGDPITATGDLDFAPADRKMIGSAGPFNMAPGDSQFVSIRVAAVQGGNRLLSLSTMRFFINTGSPSCCVGMTGDLNGDGADGDIVDLAILVDHLHAGGQAPPCEGEGNVDGVTGIDAADLAWLVDFLFAGGPAPLYCP